MPQFIPLAHHYNTIVVPTGAAFDAVQQDHYPGDPIPPLTLPHDQYSSFDDFYKDLIAFGTQVTVALILTSCSNYRVVNGKNIPTYRLIKCDRGDRRPSTATGLQQVTTKQVNCSFRLRVCCTQIRNWQWTWKVIQSNHKPWPVNKRSSSPYTSPSYSAAATANSPLTSTGTPTL